MFYEFGQNNSGGSFVIDNDLTCHVIIEADNDKEANKLAEGVGVYFNGCDDNIDCNCCGDRWYEQYEEEGDEVPSVYGTPVAEWAKSNKHHWAPLGHQAVVYYKDGTKRWY